MTKKRAIKEEPPVIKEPRRHRSLRQKEERIRRRIILITSITLVLVAGLIAYGLLNEYVFKQRRAIAVVNQDKISVGAFQRRLRFEQDNLVSQINQYIQFGQQFAGQGGSNPFQSIINQLVNDLSAPENYSLTVLDMMTEEALIRQLAAQYDVQVSPDDVQLYIEGQFGYDRNATPTPTPEAGSAVTDTVAAGGSITAEEFQSRYNQFIADLGTKQSITEEEFRQMVATQLMREGLQKVAPLEVDTTDEMVHVRAIVAQTQADPLEPVKAEADALAKAFEARKRIVEDGEDFGEVAKEVSEDPGSAPDGGELGWISKGQTVAEFEDAAFSLPVGEVSQPVKTDFGFHLIQVEEKNEAGDQVRARHILIRIDTTPPQEAQDAAAAKAMQKIEDAKARIEAGEDFAAVAKEVSEDPVSAEKGGDLGWIAADNKRFPADVVSKAFELAPGQLSEPIETEQGIYLITVEEKDPEHPVDDNVLQSRRQQAFDDWLQAQKEAATIENKWSLDLVPPLPDDLAGIVAQLQLAAAQSQSQSQSPSQ